MRVKSRRDELKLEEALDALSKGVAIIARGVRRLTTDLDAVVQGDAVAVEEIQALEARAEAHFGSVSAPMATAEHLVVLKAMAGRPKDIDDIESLLALYPTIDAKKARAHLKELQDLSGESGIVEAFDEVVSRQRPASRRKQKGRRR